jgi:hypothetical protein
MRIISPQTWCLTIDGKRVPERHPLSRFMLVGKGCEIEEAELEKYPIYVESEAKAIAQPPEIKAMEAPKSKKPKR